MVNCFVTCPLTGSDIDVECSPETQQELLDNTSSVLEENSGSPMMMGEALPKKKQKKKTSRGTRMIGEGTSLNDIPLSWQNCRCAWVGFGREAEGLWPLIPFQSTHVT